ncbi:MAG: phosphodiester glycosidase family protein [Clostridia bacterium]|nr:phosphodiester glycosidase family protein [Clostridia bacterium]
MKRIICVFLIVLLTFCACGNTGKNAAQNEGADIVFPIRYRDDGVEITIEKERYLGTCCYIAHIRLSDFSRLKTGMAKDGYGKKERPARFAEERGCLLTVNGDYSEGVKKGVLRGGAIFRDETAVVDGAYSQITGLLTEAKGATLSELAARGYTDSFGFGAGVLVQDGKSVYFRKDGGKKAQRTLIGTTGEPGDIYIVVTEGRYSDGTSPGLQYFEAGDLLESLGCTYGVALDGGASSSMVWNGIVLDHNRSRKVTGFVYVTDP